MMDWAVCGQGLLMWPTAIQTLLPSLWQQTLAKDSPIPTHKHGILCSVSSTPNAHICYVLCLVHSESLKSIQNQHNLTKCFKSLGCKSFPRCWYENIKTRKCTVTQEVMVYRNITFLPLLLQREEVRDKVLEDLKQCGLTGIEECINVYLKKWTVGSLPEAQSCSTPHVTFVSWSLLFNRWTTFYPKNF